MSNEQFNHLFETIEKGDKIMEEVKLKRLVLEDINEESLVNCFVKKIKRLTLQHIMIDYNENLDDDFFETLLDKFMINLKHSDSIELTHLTLHFDFNEYPDNLADGVCKVQNVKLCDYEYVPVASEVMKRLLENILLRPIVMKTLIIDIADLREEFCPDFGSLISPQDLKTVFSKMATLHLEGIFNLEQLEAVRSLPDVEVIRKELNPEQFCSHSLKKGPSGMF